MPVKPHADNSNLARKADNVDGKLHLEACYMLSMYLKSQVESAIAMKALPHVATIALRLVQQRWAALFVADTEQSPAVARVETLFSFRLCSHRCASALH